MKNFLTILILFLIGCSGGNNISFNNFEKSLENITDTTDRQCLADNFMKKLSQKDYPIFENDSTVVLLYQGSAEKVQMIGDLNYWTYPATFQKIDGTDLSFLRLNIRQNSLLEYWLIVDGQTQIDSLNQYKVKNEFGFASQVVNHKKPMLRSQNHDSDDHLYKTYLVPRSNNKYLKIHIYLPPGYNDYENFPLILFLDGKNYIDYGETPAIIDDLIAKGKIQDIVAVFVEIGFDIESNQSVAAFFDETGNIISGEMMGYLENRFSIVNNPEDRVLVGKSITGGAAVLAVLENPNIFGNSFCQSGYLTAENRLLEKNLAQSRHSNTHFYFQIGIYERNVSHLIIPPDETDFYEETRAFVARMKKSRFSVKLEEFSAGHSWGNWKNHLSNGLVYFFGKEGNSPE